MNGSAAIRSHRAFLSDVRLHYVEAGRADAPALVLLHGWPQTWLEWIDIIPALSENYRVIAPDLRGLGDSSQPKSGYDARTVAGDIVELADYLGLKTMHLVGHDIGAIVGYALASHWRDRVTALAFLDAFLPGFGLDKSVQLHAGGWGLWHFALHASPLADLLIQGREGPYLSWFYRTLSYAPDAIPRERIDAYIRSYSQPGTMRAAFAHYSAFYEDGLQNKAASVIKLKIPVLALGGSATVGPLVAEEMRQVADNVIGDVVPECGHWMAEEQGEWLVVRLIHFFEKNK